MTLNMSAITLNLIAGLGLFIYGMQLMAEGLQKAAGDKMRRLLEVLTSNPLVAVMVGTAVTAIIQSSSATTVMVIGFVNAGLMTLRQAVGVILGANIGTTVTTQLVSFKLTHFAPVAIGAGVVLLMISKKKSTRDLAQILLGFGILFFGMSTMSGAMKPLRAYPPFINLMTNVADKPLYGVFIAAAFTAVIQSSSATTAIVVALASQGLLDLGAALPLILGSNIGTTITALLASVNTTLTSRRAAVAHAIFNVGGVLLFLLLLKPFTAFAASTSVDTARQIANAHTIFNIANTLLVLPFINAFVKLIQVILPGADKAEKEPFKALYLDPNLLGNPSIALGQATRELYRMGQLAGEMLLYTETAFERNDPSFIKKADTHEESINYLERAITNYLVDISQSSLTEAQSQRLNYLFESVNDIERIGDHAENIAELASSKIERKLPFSGEAMAELQGVYKIIKEMIEDCLETMRNKNIPLANRVMEQEELIDELEADLRQKHIRRLSERVCHTESGVIYLDIISNFERIADHANNVSLRSIK